MFFFSGETKLIIKNVQLSHDGEYLLQVQINENERPSGDIKLGTKCKVVVMGKFCLVRC